MGQPEESEQGVESDDNHGKSLDWRRLQKLETEHLESWDGILLLRDLLGIWIYVVYLIDLKMHESPYNYTINHCQAWHRFKLVYEEAVEK